MASDLLARLEALRPEMAAAAQAVVDEWVQGEDGLDEEFGSGGVCDRVSDALAEVIGSVDGVEVTDGGHDGDDHAWLIVYDDEEAYGVDVPPLVSTRSAGGTGGRSSMGRPSPPKTSRYGG